MYMCNQILWILHTAQHAGETGMDLPLGGKPSEKEKAKSLATNLFALAASNHHTRTQASVTKGRII